MMWLAAAALFVVAAGLLTAGSAEQVCRSCHAPQSKALSSSPHAGVRCYGCHLDDGAWGVPERKTAELAGMYPLALLGRGFEGAARLSSRSACLACHADISGRVTDSSGLRIDHDACAAESSSCDECHSMTAHGTSVRWRSKPVMEECTACHRARGATTRCESCHTQRNNSAGPPGPWQVTHGPNWQKLHGMGDLASCETCHEADFCKSCHGLSLPHGADFGVTHGNLAKQDPNGCIKCHRSSAFCDACHGAPMPHPSGFLRDHAKAAKGIEDPSCSRCHVQGDCADCHSKHVHPGGSFGVPAPRRHAS